MKDSQNHSFGLAHNTTSLHQIYTLTTLGTTSQDMANAYKGCFIDNWRKSVGGYGDETDSDDESSSVEVVPDEYYIQRQPDTVGGRQTKVGRPLPKTTPCCSLSQIDQSYQADIYQPRSQLPKSSSPPSFYTMDTVLQPTQPATQPVDRLTRHSSSLSSEDLATTICVLLPAGAQAQDAVKATMLTAPQHILQNDDLAGIVEDDLMLPQYQDTRQIALRLTSSVKSSTDGFIFGRNPNTCDVLLSSNASDKLISNKHFKIFINSQGSLMIRDMSTNGTMVDDKMIKARGTVQPPTRALENGTIISVLGGPEKIEVKFAVRIPPREDYQDEYEENLRRYLEARGLTPNFKSIRESHYGNHWNGGSEYNFTGNLGKGAFATVYRIQTKREGNMFAAKEIDKKRFVKNGILDIKFDNELKIMSSLKHPNIVEYIDCQRYEDWIYIIMEYVPHGELSQELRDRGSLPEPQVQQIVRQILHALHYLHRRGVTHRDIKPDNILIASRDPFTVKLSDFGLSKSVADQETFLKTFCGTLLYCAPEVYPDFATYSLGATPKRRRPGDPSPRPSPYDESVDMWSFGAVIYHLLAGKAPILGRGDDRGQQMLNNIMTKDVDFRPLRDRNVTEDAVDFIHHLLRRNPTERPKEPECLNHPWLRDIPDMYDYTDEGPVPELMRQTLARVEEAEEEDVDMILQGFEQASQSIRPDVASPISPCQPNKRQRVSKGSESQADPVKYPTLPSLPSFESPKGGNTAPGKLFGEINASVLRSSGVFGIAAPIATTPAMPEIQDRVEQISVNDFRSAGPDSSPDDASMQPPLHAHAFTTPKVGAPAGSAASLFGAEAQIEDLRVATPDTGTAGEGSGTATEPGPTVTRQLSASSSNDQPVSHAQSQSRSHPAKFSRIVDLDLINDRAAFEAERAARAASRIEKKQKAETFQIGQNSRHAPSMEFAKTIDVTTGSQRGIHTNARNNDLERRLIPGERGPSDFVTPPRRFGKLTTLEGSFANVTINLDRRTTAWGRDSRCEARYPDLQETRVPKIGLKVFFYSKGVEEFEKDNDWTRYGGIETIVSTSASKGILINGTRLNMISEDDAAGEYGKIYSGDIITIQQPDDPTFLKFKVEITFGDSARNRPESEKPFILRRDAKGYAEHKLRQTMHSSRMEENKAFSEINGKSSAATNGSGHVLARSMPAPLPAAT